MPKIDPYKLFVSYNGLYESPKDERGEYKGPLVAYAGKDPSGKNYVGFSYFNVAKIEQPSRSRAFFANLLAKKINDKIGVPNHLVAAPMGGIIFSVTTADILNCNVSFFEKKITKLANPENGTKEESKLVYNRHEIAPDESVIIFEDLCNNFSTTQKMVDFLRSMGVKVVAIACVLNRSPHLTWKEIPIISAIHIPTPEYKQTDSEVIKLIESGQIVWKPKAEWGRLKEAMKNH